MHAGDFLFYLLKNSAFERWKRRKVRDDMNDADPDGDGNGNVNPTMEEFMSGPWQRVRARLCPRHARLPCELAADRTWRPRFLDRMPCYVRNDGSRLEGELAMLMFTH